MEESTIEFYLTGSRIFGGQKVNSDWDFFTLYVPETQKFLDMHGFHFVSKGYKDELCAAVYQNIYDNIHVQLVGDVLWKDLAQTYILTYLHDVYLQLPKDKRRLLWNYAFNQTKGLLPK